MPYGAREGNRAPGGRQIRIGAAGKRWAVARARAPGVAGNGFNKYFGWRARRVWRGTTSTNIPGVAHAGGRQEQGVEFIGGRPAGSWGIYLHQVEILRPSYIYSVVEQGDGLPVGNGAAAARSGTNMYVQHTAVRVQHWRADGRILNALLSGLT